MSNDSGSLARALRPAAVPSLAREARNRNYEIIAHGGPATRKRELRESNRFVYSCPGFRL